MLANVIEQYAALPATGRPACTADFVPALCTKHNTSLCRPISQDAHCCCGGGGAAAAASAPVSDTVLRKAPPNTFELSEARALTGLLGMEAASPVDCVRARPTLPVAVAVPRVERSWSATWRGLNCTQQCSALAESKKVHVSVCGACSMFSSTVQAECSQPLPALLSMGWS